MNKPTSITALAASALLAAILAIGALGACSAEQPAADTPANASATQDSESNEPDTVDEESPTSEPEPAPYPATTYSQDELEEIEEEQDAFAHDLLMESAQKLVDGGVLSDIDGNGLFPFDGQYGSTDMSLEFKDEQQGKYLTHAWSYVEDLDGVVIARAMFEERYGERQESCEVCDKYGMFGNYSNELIDSVPRFYPSECQNHTEFGIDEDHPETWGLFADSLDECKYLIVYGAFESKREEDFYMQGDRVTISTLVILIDAQNREIVAIEDIGCDTPPAFKAESGIGETLDSEARAFVMDKLYAIAA